MPSAPARPDPVDVVDAGRSSDDSDPVIAVERERERLADLLHNGLMQSLVVARHALDRDRRPRTDLAAGLPSADEALAACLAETRRAIWHLRPRTLDADLRPALDELAHRLGADGGSRLVLDVADAPTLSPDRAALAYRVIQALALTSDPGAVLTVTVTVTGSPDRARVRVVGCSPGAERAGDVGDRILQAERRGVSVELVSA